MKTATYLRFSSDMQKETSIEDQLRNVETHCQRMGWPMPRVFKDHAITASRNDRPGYNEMLRAAEAKEFDIFVVDDLSRPWRDELEQMKSIRVFKYLGIRIISVSDGIDTDRDSYKIETTLRGMVNELYLDDLAKKTHRGIMGRALAGYSAGKFPYGYMSTNDGRGFKREINEDQAVWVQHIFTRYAEGISTRRIALELNNKGIKSPSGGRWAHSTIEPYKGTDEQPGMLANPLYIGQQIWNRRKNIKDPITGRKKRIDRPREEWVVIEHPELRIISDELWKQCEDRIAQQKAKKIPGNKSNSGRTSKYLFNGLLRCGVCGGRIVMKNIRIYGCANTIDRDAHVCTNKNNIHRTVLETRLLEGIKKELLSEEMYQAFEKETETLLSTGKVSAEPVKARIAQAQKELDNLMVAIKAGIITATTKAAVETAERQIAEAQAELKALENYEPANVLPHAKEVYQGFVLTLGCIENVHQAREALRKLVGTITLYPRDKELVAELEHGNLSPALSEMSISCPQLTHSRQSVSKIIPLY